MNAAYRAETVRPIAQPLFSSGKSSPIMEYAIMLIIAAPTPMKN